MTIMTAMACIKSNCNARPWSNSLFCLRHLFEHLSSTFSHEKRHNSGQILGNCLRGDITRAERLMLILRLWEQFTYRECAATLDVSESTARRILYRAINKMYTEELQPGLRVYPFRAPEPPVIEVTKVITTELIEVLKKHPLSMYQIKPRQFEELIAEILASNGWNVQLTPATRDGGYDIFAISKDMQSGTRTSWIIECKKYAPENKVGVNIVRTLYGVKSDRKAANALLATSSYYTKGAKAFRASRYDIELKDYNDILEWINQYKPSPDGKLYLKDNGLILPNED